MKVIKALLSVGMLAAYHVPAFPLERLFCHSAVGRRMYTTAFNGTGLPWMNMTGYHSNSIPPGMLMGHDPQFTKHNVSSFPLNDTDVAQGLRFQTLTAEPPWLNELDDLWARFHLLECWDANQRHGWNPGEWKCPGVKMWIYGTYGWCDPFDIWDQSNGEARKVLADPNINIRSYPFRWERSMGLTVGARGWYPVQ